MIFFQSGIVESKKAFDDIPGCKVPYELKRGSRANAWKSRIGWRARNQMTSWYTTHTRSRFLDNRNCGRAASLYINNHDDGVMHPGEGEGFVDGGNYDRSYSGYCHTGNLGQNDQWKHPDFVRFVNNLFYAKKESWRPF